MHPDDSVLVTGGAGFIGANFVLGLMGQGRQRVVNLDALTYAGNLETLASLAGNERHVFVQGNIGDRSLVAGLLAKYQPAAVVNFAAESHVDRSIDGPAAFIETNISGTFNLLDTVRDYWGELSSARAEAFRFLHVSTDEVYGSLGATGLFAEDSPYAPNSPYAASKAASDHLVRAWHHTYGLPVLTTNCSNNYGPHQFPEKLLPLTILNALEGKPLPVYGDGNNIRDWLFVSDHCAAIHKVMESGAPGAVYNVGGSGERTNLDMVKAICAILDRRLPDSPACPHEQLITFVADRPGHDRRYAIDATRIREELGWRPAETLDTGLEKTVDWYLENRDWCRRVQDGSYRRERLGLGE